jgi:hypothetical protein
VASKDVRRYIGRVTDMRELKRMMEKRQEEQKKEEQIIGAGRKPNDSTKDRQDILKDLRAINSEIIEPFRNSVS